MTAVDVIVPYWGEDCERCIAANYIEQRLADAGLGVVVADQRDPAQTSKGAILWPAIQASDADILVLHDADVWCDGLALAIDAVASGMWAWGKPHDYVYRLAQDASDLYRACSGGVRLATLQLARPAYRGTTGGGIVVARRELLLDVPMDPRFEGWGQEDQALGAALWTLHGPPWMGDAPLVHLWHEPRPRLDHRWGSIESKALYHRYHHATTDPAKMLALISEAHDALQSAQPASHRRLAGV